MILSILAIPISTVHRMARSHAFRHEEGLIHPSDVSRNELQMPRQLKTVLMVASHHLALVFFFGLVLLSFTREP